MAEKPAENCEQKKPTAMTIMIDGLSAKFDVPKEIEGREVVRVLFDVTLPLAEAKHPVARPTFVVVMPDDDEKFIPGNAAMLMP